MKAREFKEDVFECGNIEAQNEGETKESQSD